MANVFTKEPRRDRPPRKDLNALDVMGWDMPPNTRPYIVSSAYLTKAKREERFKNSLAHQESPSHGRGSCFRADQAETNRRSHSRVKTRNPPGRNPSLLLSGLLHVS